MRKLSKPYTLWVDDREKKPWTEEGILPEEIFKVQRIRMDFGDYKIKGLENVFAIERKANWLELYQNMTQYRLQFMTELERLKVLPYAFLVIDDTLQSMSRTMIHTKTGSRRVDTSIIMNIYTRLLLVKGLQVVLTGGPSVYRTALIQNIFYKVIADA